MELFKIGGECPEKNYIFIVEFPEIKLHLKAETSAEARGWVKNIYE